MVKNNFPSGAVPPAAHSIQTERVTQEDERPRVAMISFHDHIAANPPPGADDAHNQAVYVLELAKKLAQLGYDVDIWTRLPNGQFAIEPGAERVRILRMACDGAALPPSANLGDQLAVWGEHALRYIAENDLSYSFISSHYWDAGLAGQQLSTALHIPHMHTPHSLGWCERKRMETNAPWLVGQSGQQFDFEKRLTAERLIYQSCDTVVVISPAQRDLIVQEYGTAKAKVHVIPGGYDDNRFFSVGVSARAAIRRRLGFRGRVIMAGGRLARNKGFDLLIDAFPVVARRDPEAVLLLAVGGKQLNEGEQAILAELKQAAAQTGYGNRIRFNALIEEREMPDYYRAADLFVLSSRYEPFDVTAIEAMASGVPTVVPVHGGLHRALSFGRHAVSADPFDRLDLGITIATALRDSQMRARLSRMGAHLARSLFTWSAIGHQLIGLLQGPARPRSDRSLAPVAMVG